MAAPREWWTPARRQEYARLLRRRAPWKASSGPRSLRGKEVVARNTLKNGMRDRGSMAGINTSGAISSLHREFVKMLDDASE